MKSDSKKITVRNANEISVIVTSLAGTVCGVMSPYPKNVKFSVLKYRHSNARSAPHQLRVD